MFGHLCIFSEVTAISVLCPFLKLSYKGSLYIPDTSLLADNVVCKYPLPLCGLSFHFLYGDL